MAKTYSLKEGIFTNCIICGKAVKTNWLLPFYETLLCAECKEALKSLIQDREHIALRLSDHDTKIRELAEMVEGK